MLKLPLLALTVIAAIALTATTPAPAQAGAVHLTPSFGLVAGESNVIEVRRHHRRHSRNRDSMIALGIGSAIIGGMIASQHAPAYGPVYGPGYAPGYGYGSSAWDACAGQFRSLRADGTYTTYDGRQVLCPYLR